MGSKVVGETDGDMLGFEVMSLETDGDMLGSEVVGEIVGETVGYKVVGETDGDSVGSELVGENEGETVESEVVGETDGDLGVVFISFADWRWGCLAVRFAVLSPVRFPMGLEVGGGGSQVGG